MTDEELIGLLVDTYDALDAPAMAAVRIAELAEQVHLANAERQADRLQLTAEIERLRAAASEAFSEVLELDLDRYQQLLTEHGRDVGDGVVVFP